MRVVVTGASGFIGSHLVPALRSAGHTIADLQPRFPGRAAFRGDCHAIVHLAGLAHKKASDFEFYYANERLTAKVAKCAAICGAKLIFVSTAKVCGESGDFRDDTPPNPSPGYARSKHAAEAHVAVLDRHVILRPPLVYGPCVKANFRRLLRLCASGIPLPLAGCFNLRSMIYVRNLVDAILFSLGPAAHGIYFVSDPATFPVAYIAREMRRLAGGSGGFFRVPEWMLPRQLTQTLTVDDMPFRKLGWYAPHGVEAGLRETCKWWRDECH